MIIVNLVIKFLLSYSFFFQFIEGDPAVTVLVKKIEEAYLSFAGLQRREIQFYFLSKLEKDVAFLAKLFEGLVRDCIPALLADVFVLIVYQFHIYTVDFMKTTISHNTILSLAKIVVHLREGFVHPNLCRLHLRVTFSRLCQS